VARTPIEVRGKVPLRPVFAASISARLARRIGHAARLIERGAVRFTDVNGPRGGDDTACAIQLVLSQRPAVLVRETAADAEHAFAAALAALTEKLTRERRRHGLRGGPATHGSVPPPAGSPGVADDDGEIIGRRRGRHGQPLAAALDRPEKRRRDAYVDTSAPGVSASDRRAGGNISARRNSRKGADGATAMLEDSRTTPSRKSTRRSANRSKSGQQKERAARQRVATATHRHGEQQR
jgi:hypothetical protein